MALAWRRCFVQFACVGSCCFAQRDIYQQRRPRTFEACPETPPSFAPLLRLIGAAATYADPAKEPLTGDVEILLGGSKVLEVSTGPQNRTVLSGPAVTTIDVTGMHVVPGFVDMHVHVAGGGGEAGYRSRTPEAQLSELVEAGLTTVVGVRGTDGISRSAEGLLAVVKALAEDGLTALAWTGSYGATPPSTVTGSVRRDVMLVAEVIGVGEVAISDHRSSNPSPDELRQLAAEARVAGLLAGKAGVLYCHMGDAPTGLAPLWDVVQNTALPIRNVIPTHVSRSAALVDAVPAWLRAGGIVDLTADADLTPAAIRRYWRAGLNMSGICCSTDAYGSAPEFDAAGRLVRYAVTSPLGSLRLLRRLVLEDGVPMAVALPLFTSNPADALALPQKGRLTPGADADILVLDPTDGYRILYVVSRGKVLKTPGWTAHGMFEACNPLRCGGGESGGIGGDGGNFGAGNAGGGIDDSGGGERVDGSGWKGRMRGKAALHAPPGEAREGQEGKEGESDEAPSVAEIDAPFSAVVN